MAAHGIPASPDPRALVTVAFLKARFDERSDHLDMFMALIADAVDSLGDRTFTVVEVQDAVNARHGLAMPQHTITTLLGRLKKSGSVKREFDRYKAVKRLRSRVDVRTEMARIEGEQRQLAAALREHAKTRGVAIESDEKAFSMLLEFIEQQHVDLLLNDIPNGTGRDAAQARETLVLAEFVKAAIDGDRFADTIRDILEGLVLYRAAFLPDISQTKKHFSNLRVFFDSGIVRQALGYEGPVLRALARESLDVLRAAGVQVLVFDKTVDEIRRILTSYERKLATIEGRRSIWPSEMATHFLRERFTPADVAQMAVLLDRELSSAGYQVMRTPERVPAFTLDEKALAAGLADPNHDEDSPRVTHDVDCVAAVLTLRKGVRAARIDDAMVVFASSATPVVRCVTRWYKGQITDRVVPPIIHIRALANLAWLKRPAVATDFKLREMVALCSAALRPSRQTWERFLKHLETLRQRKTITSDEEAAIVVSGLVERLLSEAELADGDSGPDAQALDDVVEKVKAAYAADAATRIAAVVAERDAVVAEARANENVAIQSASSAAEKLREVELLVDRRARGIARALAYGLSYLAAGAVAVGATAIALSHEVHGGWKGILVAVGIFVFVALEVFGVLQHLGSLRSHWEAALTPRVRRWLVRPEPTHTSGDPPWASS
jgi:predicted transcriptional regulator